MESFFESYYSSERREELYQKFKAKIVENSFLKRNLVSFQANKGIPFSGWFKYREAFSEKLVIYLLQNLKPEPGVLLDPFSGIGSALFAGISLGWETIGIELLPVGVYATRARVAAYKVSVDMFSSIISEIKDLEFSNYYDQSYAFNHIKITQEAFPPEEEKQLIGYISYCHKFVENEEVRTLLVYAAFCILEDISYTKKDGQYLRWDFRSGRSQGKKPFNKGKISSFHNAICQKLELFDLDLKLLLLQKDLFGNSSYPCLETGNNRKNYPILEQDTCLKILPKIQSESIDFILTSPPYLNRYDYTRTYALELIFLRTNESEVKKLRQTMLSCTVENRDKNEWLRQLYTSGEREQEFGKINSIFQEQAALHEVLEILEMYKNKKKLNNSNIPRMVRNYFYEMCFIIYELARLLKPGGIVTMVNDNVRYAGEEIPVDLILSNIAESFGLTTKYIWTLGRGKGNSSQQMGTHGRSELRKCVYVWEK